MTFIVLVLLVLVPASASVSIPRVDFSANTTSGPAPLAVKFTDTSLGSGNTGWGWFFGDETYKGPWELRQGSASWSQRQGHSTAELPVGHVILTGGWPLNSETWLSPDEGVTWQEQNASSGWFPRNGQTMVALPDNSLVLMGGGNLSSTMNDTWRSTDYGVRWNPVNTSSGWSPRITHTSVALPDGSIVLMGGSNGPVKLNDVWRSTNKGYTWTLMTSSAGWSPRGSHTSVVMPDGRIVLMGGTTDYGWANDVWQSLDKGATWTQTCATAPWSPRYGLSSVALPDNSIVLLGGQVGINEAQNDMWRSTNYGATWTRVNASSGWSQRSFHSSLVLRSGNILLTGGSNSSFRNDVWRMSPAGSSLQHPVHVYANPGTYQVSLIAYTGAGPNSTRKAGYIKVTAPPSPAVTGITPATGAQGSTVIISNLSGSRFAAGANVSLNRTGSARIYASNVVVVSPAKITCRFVIPAGAATGLWNVDVRNSNGKLGSKVGAFTVTPAPAPTVNGIAPAAGVRGKYIVVSNLSGTKFLAGAKVSLNRTGYPLINATNVTVVSATKITCTFTIPANAPLGARNVDVRNVNGKIGVKANAFLVKAPAAPTVTGITPATGKRGRLVIVTNISGTGFVGTPKPQVRFIQGSAVLNATNITVASAKKITCTVKIPANAPLGAWNVRVTNGDNQAGTKAGIFTVAP